MTVAPKRRRLWQIHLSTAVLLMLTASVLLFLNMRQVHRVLPPGETADFGWRSMMHPEPPQMDYIVVAQRPGWPLTSSVVVAYKGEKPFNGLYHNAAEDGNSGINWAIHPATPEEAVAYTLSHLSPETTLSRRNWNIGIAATILLAVLVVAELIARRKAVS